MVHHVSTVCPIVEGLMQTVDPERADSHSQPAPHECTAACLTVGWSSQLGLLLLETGNQMPRPIKNESKLTIILTIVMKNTIDINGLLTA